MGLLDFIGKQFIDVIQWTEPEEGILSYRYPMRDMEIQNGAQLVVRESQMAAFVNEGRAADIFGPGTYTLTTNTLPPVQNRDLQGRLRKKLTVLKIGRWTAHHVLDMLGCTQRVHGPLYAVDMSSKNPRFDTMVYGAVGHLRCGEKTTARE